MEFVDNTTTSRLRNTLFIWARWIKAIAKVVIYLALQIAVQMFCPYMADVLSEWYWKK